MCSMNFMRLSKLTASAPDGVMVPTEAVDDTPINGMADDGASEPSATVEAWPVRATDVDGASVPLDAVDETPVNPTVLPCVSVTVPRATVELTPERETFVA
jgi:hypothetical protein